MQNIVLLEYIGCFRNRGVDYEAETALKGVSERA